jgi:hypothetical protein
MKFNEKFIGPGILGVLGAIGISAGIFFLTKRK